MSTEQIEEIELAAFRSFAFPGFTLQSLSSEALNQERDAMIAKYGNENWCTALTRAKIRSHHISWIFQRLREEGVDAADVFAESRTYVVRDKEANETYIFEVGGSDSPVRPEHESE